MINKRPKRRKSKDNPYTLKYIETQNIYIVSFKDHKGIIQDVEVSKEIFVSFDRFELDDIKELNEYDRHIEHSEIFEETLNNRIKDKIPSLEDEIIRKATFEELKLAIEQLPEIQKRRIKKYYFAEKNEYEIAKEEHTTQQAVNKSLRLAIQKLKEILKK